LIKNWNLHYSRPPNRRISRRPEKMRLSRRKKS